MLPISIYYIICVIVRLSLAYLSYLLYNSRWRFALVLFLLGAASGFTYLFFTKQRQTGAFGQKIWWDFLRPIHALLYIASACLLSFKVKEVYIILIIDALVGVPLHIRNRYL